MKEKYMESYYKEIEARIKEFDHKPFTESDFSCLASRETIRKSLQRLNEKRTIVRISRGIYYVPRYIPLIDEYSAPDLDEVAHAIARLNKWTICPSVSRALNETGLSSQVPNAYKYVSSGPYREYVINGQTIYFTHACNKRVSPSFSQDAMLIYQAIKGTYEGGGILSESDMITLKTLCDKLGIYDDLLEMSDMSFSSVHDTVIKLGEINV